MPIREKGYYKWEGEFSGSPFKWLPIYLNGIKSVFRKRWAKILFFFSLSPFFLFFLAVLFLTRPEFAWAAEAVKELKDNPSILYFFFYTNGGILFLNLFVAIFSGGDLISADKRHNSLTMYLSRPISRLDYVIGKFAVVFSYLMAFTFVPGITLVFFHLVFSGALVLSFGAIAAAILLPVVISAFFASMCLLLSSFSANGRWVNVMIFFTYLSSFIVVEPMIAIFEVDALAYLSIFQNMQRFGSFLFDVNIKQYPPSLLSGFILIAMSALFFWLVYKRIKKAEV